MPKCANFVCLNDVKVGFRTETYCRSCIQSDQPFVFLCDVCDNTFTSSGRNGHLSVSCSERCRKIKRSIKSKVRYMKKNPAKEKECPSCKKKFIKNTKYCSYECHGQRFKLKFQRHSHASRVREYLEKEIPNMTPYIEYNQILNHLIR